MWQKKRRSVVSQAGLWKSKSEFQCVSDQRCLGSSDSNFETPGRSRCWRCSSGTCRRIELSVGHQTRQAALRWRGLEQRMVVLA